MTVVLCITGMHRSGTSLLASWLEQCGLTIHNGKVLGPTVGNPRGHFEDKDFVEFHSSAIRSRGTKTRGWKLIANTSQEFNEEERCKANEIVRQRNEKLSFWGWKDPRSVLFLNQWKKIIPSLQVLFVWRSCAEVVDSLTERSHQTDRQVFKVGMIEAIKLWRSYNSLVCEFKSRYPYDTFLFHKNDLIQNDHDVLRLINERFGTSLFYRPISQVLDKSLIHKRSSFLSKIATSFYRCSSLEQTLRSTSDIKPLDVS